MAKIYIDFINIHVRRVCNACIVLVFFSISFPVFLSTSSDLPWSCSCPFHVLRSVLFWSSSCSFYPIPSVLFWSSSCSFYPIPSVLFWSSLCSFYPILSVLFWSSSCFFYPIPSVLFWSSSCSFYPIPSVLSWSSSCSLYPFYLPSSGPTHVLLLSFPSVLLWSSSCSSFYPFHLSSSGHSRPQSSSHPCHSTILFLSSICPLYAHLIFHYCPPRVLHLSSSFPHLALQYFFLIYIVISKSPPIHIILISSLCSCPLYCFFTSY
jgi:hypothetical protein